MRELYVSFTPYHILLNSSIASRRSLTADKEIIIIEDFSDAEKMLNGLKGWKDNPFKEHIMIKGIFSVDEIPEKSIFNVFRSNSVVNVLKEGIESLDDRYGDAQIDKVFTCNDGRPHSQFLEYKCKKKRGHNIYVEDGSSVYNDFVGPILPLHESIFYNLYYGRWYEKTRVLGNYRYTDEIRAFRPDLVRPELRDKKIETIDMEGFTDLKKTGLTEKILDEFSVKLQTDYDNMILFLPHSELIRKRNLLPLYQKIVSKVREDDKKILLKYHPREKDHYLSEQSDGIFSLPQSLPSELLLLHMIEKPPLIIGDISTCLLTSKFLREDFKVISLINIIGMESENLKRAFKKIGVLMPNTHSELEVILKEI